MKKILLMLLWIGMVFQTLAAESPFKKSTTYLNFNFRINGNGHYEITHFGMLGILAEGDSLGSAKLILDTRQNFETMATGINLEFGLTNHLGLEFQYYSRSNQGAGLCIESQNPPGIDEGSVAIFPLDWAYASGTYRERVMSLGGNYHMNFIGIRRLDVFAGFQLGIETRNYTIPSRLDEVTAIKEQFMEKEITMYPGTHFGEDQLLLYSHLAAGVNYFVTDKIALTLRSGVKFGSKGLETEVFYGAGLTIKL